VKVTTRAPPPGPGPQTPETPLAQRAHRHQPNRWVAPTGIERHLGPLPNDKQVAIAFLGALHPRRSVSEPRPRRSTRVRRPGGPAQ